MDNQQVKEFLVKDVGLSEDWIDDGFALEIRNPEFKEKHCISGKRVATIYTNTGQVEIIPDWHIITRQATKYKELNKAFKRRIIKLVDESKHEKVKDDQRKADKLHSESIARERVKHHIEEYGEIFEFNGSNISVKAGNASYPFDEKTETVRLANGMWSAGLEAPLHLAVEFFKEVELYNMLT